MPTFVHLGATQIDTMRESQVSCYTNSVVHEKQIPILGTAPSGSSVVCPSQTTGPACSDPKSGAEEASITDNYKPGLAAPLNDECKKTLNLILEAPHVSSIIIDRHTYPNGVDPIRDFLQGMDNGKDQSDLATPEEYFRLVELAQTRTPLTMREAMDSMGIVSLNQSFYKGACKLLRVKNGSELRQTLMKELIASKLVQRQLSLETILQCLENFDIDNPQLVTDQHQRLRKLRETTVKGRKYHKQGKEVIWVSGDIPCFDEEGEVIPGAPFSDDENRNEIVEVGVELLDAESEDSLDSTPSEFQPDEYCRLFHTLAEQSMIKHLGELLDPALKDKPWVERVAPIFNQQSFNPSPVKTVSGGVRKSEIQGLVPKFWRRRDGETLQQKFAEFKSLYRSAVRSYLQWGNDETDTFSDFCQGKSYIMYAFCLLDHYPELEPLTLKATVEPICHSESPDNSNEDGQLKRGRKVVFSDEADDEASGIAPSPVAKRARAAMLQDTERAELQKIIEGGIPGEVGAGNDLTGSTHTNGLTKSEAIQQMEKEERERALLASMKRNRTAKIDVAGNNTDRVFPRSAAIMEAEQFAREKARTEASDAKVKYITSLLVAIKEARAMLGAAVTEDERNVYKEVLDELLSKLKRNRIDSSES